MILRQAYQIVAGSGLHVAVGASEATQAITKNKVYVVSVNTDTYVRFHDSSAVAASDNNFDIFMPAGTTAVLRATAGTLRVIRDTADGDLGISEIEVV